MRSASAIARNASRSNADERRDSQLSSASAKIPRIVALGGGTGLPIVLEGLCALASEDGAVGVDHISGVVTVTDEGGSSGRLRNEFGVLPPGDVRNCLAALAPPDSPLKRLLQHRFHAGDGLEGHAVGNLMLVALTQIAGDLHGAVEQVGMMTPLRGRVLPTTLQHVRLRAEMDSGQVVDGETHIVGSGLPIRRLSLNPSPKPLPDVLRALINADGIVVGPGSLYTSVLPNLLVEGIAATLSGVDAVRIYVANLMTEPGETENYTLDDHLRAIRLHVGRDLFDYILVHRGALAGAAAECYALQGSTPVRVDVPLKWAGRARVVESDLAAEFDGRKIRHVSRSLGRVIRSLIAAGRRF
jgi:uncharacterized cofD-like protein